MSVSHRTASNACGKNSTRFGGKQEGHRPLQQVQSRRVAPETVPPAVVLPLVPSANLFDEDAGGGGGPGQKIGGAGAGRVLISDALTRLFTELFSLEIVDKVAFFAGEAHHGAAHFAGLEERRHLFAVSDQLLQKAANAAFRGFGVGGGEWVENNQKTREEVFEKNPEVQRLAHILEQKWIRLMDLEPGAAVSVIKSDGDLRPKWSELTMSADGIRVAEPEFV